MLALSLSSALSLLLALVDAAEEKGSDRVSKSLKGGGGHVVGKRAGALTESLLNGSATIDLGTTST